MKHSVRIIGGQWRGRKITFPSIEGLRPTQDRVRETLFNWLMHDIVGARCLDLFAGSGALGFEALSRGAKRVTFVDVNRDVCRALENNICQLKTQAAEVICGNYNVLSQSSRQTTYDIVFLDPPFTSEHLLEEAIAWLDTQKLLYPHAKIYIEAKKGLLTSNLPDNWHRSRHKSTSTLDYYLFEYISV